MPIQYHCVDFEPMGKHIAVKSGMHLLEAADRSGIKMRSGCGGQGDCGQCRVIVLDGKVSPPNEYEEENLTRTELSQGYRLACHVRVYSNVRAYIFRDSIAPELCFESEDKMSSPDWAIESA